VGSFQAYSTAGLALPGELPCLLQNRVAGEKRCLDLREPLLLDNAFLINQEEGPPGRQPARLGKIMLQDAVAPNHLEVRIIAEERVRQVQGVGKRLLREQAIRTDTKHLDIQVLELLVVGPTSRDIRRSGHAKVIDVELEEHQCFAPELAQADLPSLGARKCEVRCLLPNLHCWSDAGHNQHASQQQTIPP
jgi:hypothetical protein